MLSRTVIAAAILWGAAAFVPRIDSVSPASPVPDNAPQTIAVHGEDFQPGLRLTVTTPSGEHQVIEGDGIIARKPMSFSASVVFASVGRYELVVTNRDGTTSAPFVVEAKKKAADSPTIARVTPDEIAKQAEPQALQVEGTQFATGLKAIVTDPAGADVTPAIVSKSTPNSFELSVKLDQAGDYSIVVVNPSGATSNVYSVLVR